MHTCTHAHTHAHTHSNNDDDAVHVLMESVCNFSFSFVHSHRESSMATCLPNCAFKWRTMKMLSGI